jgi:hypothetical protein
MDCQGQQHQQLLVAVVQVAAMSVLVLMQLQVQGRWLELPVVRVWLQGLVEGVWEPKEGLALSPRWPLAPCIRLHQLARSCLLA